MRDAEKKTIEKYIVYKTTKQQKNRKNQAHTNDLQGNVYLSVGLKAEYGYTSIGRFLVWQIFSKNTWNQMEKSRLVKLRDYHAAG